MHWEWQLAGQSGRSRCGALWWGLGKHFSTALHFSWSDAVSLHFLRYISILLGNLNTLGMFYSLLWCCELIEFGYCIWKRWAVKGHWLTSPFLHPNLNQSKLLNLKFLLNFYFLSELSGVYRPLNLFLCVVKTWHTVKQICSAQHYEIGKDYKVMLQSRAWQLLLRSANLTREATL